MRKYIAAVLACLSLCALMLPALADSSAPVAENFEFETYRGVSFGGRLAAVDPEGDAVSFEITTQPKKGSIELSDDGSFVYSPIDGKRGRIDLTIPTLMEYIEICKKYGKHCVLELKNEFKASDVYKIVSMIEKAGYLDHVIFISFALKNLISLRRRYPTQPAQYLIKEWDDKLLDTLEKYNLGIDIYYKSATPDNVQKVHALGQEYNVWTVNEAVDGDALVAMGVDYITTNILEGTNKAE